MNDKIELTYLGHSAFLIQNEDVSFVVDPYRDNSVPGLTFPRVSANYVFCSHNHFDHNAKELVTIVPTNNHVEYQIIIVPHDHHNGTKRGLNNMYLFNLSGMKVLHVGDLGCIPNQNILDLIAGVDVILAPINGFYTISAKELHEICEIIKPRIVIPVHYYRKEHNSGYPDGNQIDIFKQLFNEYLEVNDYRLKITKDKPQSGAVIFKEYYQGE